MKLKNDHRSTFSNLIKLENLLRWSFFTFTKVSCYIHWRGKQKYQITNVGVKSKIVTFATKWTKLNIKYHDKFKTVFTSDNCKLSLGLERKHKHETHTLPRLWLIKFLSAHILQRRKGLVDYQGRERHGWGPMWLLYQSRKLHSALSEIVSQVSTSVSIFFGVLMLPFLLVLCSESMFVYSIWSYWPLLIANMANKDYP